MIKIDFLNLMASSLGQTCTARVRAAQSGCPHNSVLLLFRFPQPWYPIMLTYLSAHPLERPRVRPPARFRYPQQLIPW